MKMGRVWAWAAFVTAASLSGVVNAATIWDESVDGNLSTDPEAPTPVSFSAGSNIITGAVGGPGNVGDYITFTLGTNQQLTGLVLLEFQSAMGDSKAFHALNLGPTSFIPSPSTQDNFLGGNHVNAFEVGTDLLPGLAPPPAGTGLIGSGFDVPLGAGTYSYLFQQTAPDLTNYSLDFQVVPIPAALWLFGSALGMLGWYRRVGAQS